MLQVQDRDDGSVHAPEVGVNARGPTRPPHPELARASGAPMMMSSKPSWSRSPAPATSQPTSSSGLPTCSLVVNR